MSDQVKYYFKETTNQVFVSGSSTVAGMNTLLTSIKDPTPVLNSNLTAKISSLGTSISYVVQNDGQYSDTVIPIASNQELWVYRGWQPVNTLDADAYRYNPHLHRPYKAYMLTETGSGVPAFPWLPTGSTYSNSSTAGSSTNIPSIYSEKTIASNGNIPGQPGISSPSIVMGSFEVYGDNRGVHPFILTRYNSLPNSPGIGSTFTIKDDIGTVIAELFQNQTATNTNTTPTLFNNVTLPNGLYSYTSSIFNAGSGDLGFTRFGLYCDYNFFVEYTATNSSGVDIRIDYTSSATNFTPVYFDLPDGKNATYTALVGTTSTTPSSPNPATFSNIVTQNSVTGPEPQDLFATRVSDVYISYSSSLTQSIDGLYIFNQIPQADVQVTVSMLLDAWTGSDEGYKYGISGVINTDTTYSISPEPPYYGAGEEGDGPTWPTASIRIYTGSYPNNVPNVEDDFAAESTFRNENIHINGYAITMSYLIPRESLSLKDCLSVSLQVSSGSAPSESVENSLVVREYQLEFNTPTDAETGDGRVPVFLENAFKDSDGFNNAVDCQPLYNVVATDGNLRRNAQIQEVEYVIPERLLLKPNQPLYASQYPFTPASSQTYSTYKYDSSTTITTVGTSYFRLNNIATPQNTSTQMGINALLNSSWPYNSIISFMNLFINESDKSILLSKNSGADYLTFDISSITYTQGNFYSTPSYYTLNISNTDSSANDPFSDEDIVDIDFRWGKLLTFPATLTTSQITTSGTGTGMELSIISTSGGNGMSISVSNPGIGYKNGDILTIPQSLLTPVFGNSIDRDLVITLSFTYGLYNPSNFEAILANTAVKSSVPESNYTQLSSIIPKYLGSKTQANDVNSTEGLINGFGTLPVIDYRTAYLAYCDQIVDLYPVINDKTLFNIKYLINEGGDANQPNLSPYTAYDVQGSWEEGGTGRIAINQISGSSQYDALNNIQPIYSVTKLPTPYLWSQTGANSYSNYIPFATFQTTPPSNVVDYMQYGMSIIGVPLNTQNQNDFSIDLPNLISSSLGSAVIATYTFSFQSLYGLSGSISPPATVYASSSIVSSSTEIYANPGEIYFNQDLFAYNNDNNGSGQPRGNSLSDNYTINLEANFITTPPQPYTTNKKGSILNGNNPKEKIGYIQIWLEKTTSTVLNTTAWTPIKIKESTTGKGTQYIANFGGETSRIVEQDKLAPPDGVGLKSLSTEYYIGVYPYEINTTIEQFGGGKDSWKNQYYGTIKVNLQSAETLVANTRYRWRAKQEYNESNFTSQFNFWNPTTVSVEDTSGNKIGNRLTNVGKSLPTETSFSPNIKMSIKGNKTPLNLANYDPATDPNAFTAPYWDFSSSIAGVITTYHYNTLILQNPIGNSSYSINGDIMGDLPYTASINDRFPGGYEPSDTSFPVSNIPWEIQNPNGVTGQYDEIRFENNESLAFKIINSISPEAGMVKIGTENKLKIILDGEVPASTNLDFFLLRRNLYSPNSILVDTPFPYGSLAVTKEFVPSTNSTTLFTDDGGAGVGQNTATTGSMVSSQSGSIVTTYQPLKKVNDTPAAILFPEYPTDLINLEPDKVIVDLRDKKLIE